MARSLLAVLLAFTAVVLAVPNPIHAARNVGDRDTGSTPTAAPEIVEKSLAASSAAAAAAAAAASSSSTTGTCAVDSSLPGSQSVGTGTGAQFITGQCFSKADCASACCVAQSDGVALCKSEIVTEDAGLSCDFTCSSITSAAFVVPAAHSSAAV